MKNTIVCLLIVVLVYASNAEAKRKVLLEAIDPILISNPSSIEFVEQALITALLDMNWMPRSYNNQSSREIIATLYIDTHSMTVNFKYDQKSISFEYVDSTNLRYLEEDGEKYIHDAYYAWTDRLIEEIGRNLERDDLEGVISETCFGKIIQRQQTLPVNHFSLARDG